MLEKLIGHSRLGGNDFILGNTLETIRTADIQEMDNDASLYKFFEQAIEWDIMSYYFYPFTTHTLSLKPAHLPAQPLEEITLHPVQWSTEEDLLVFGMRRTYLLFDQLPAAGGTG